MSVIYTGFVIFMPYFLEISISQTKPYISGMRKVIFSILPQVAIKQIFGVYHFFYYFNFPITFDNAGSEFANYNVTTGIVMLLISSLLFTSIGVLIDKMWIKKLNSRSATNDQRRSQVMNKALDLSQNSINEEKIVGDAENSQEAIQEGEQKDQTKNPRKKIHLSISNQIYSIERGEICVMIG